MKIPQLFLVFSVSFSIQLGGALNRSTVNVVEEVLLPAEYRLLGQNHIADLEHFLG